MLKSLNLLNAALIVIVVLFVSYWLSPLLTARIKYALPPVKKLAGGNTAEKQEQPQLPSITEYAVISEENLFHPERRIPPEKKEAAPLPKPDFVLFGTLITDDLKLAYLEDLKAPHSTAGRGRRQTPLKKGDTMSGFTLKEIDAGKIVMVRGEEKMVVAVNDPAHPKSRASAITAQAPPTAQKSTPRASVPIRSTESASVTQPKTASMPAFGGPQAQQSSAPPYHPLSRKPR